MEQFVVADGEFRVLLAKCPDVGIGYLTMGNVQKMHIAFLVQFTFSKDIVNVPRDDDAFCINCESFPSAASLCGMSPTSFWRKSSALGVPT